IRRTPTRKLTRDIGALYKSIIVGNAIVILGMDKRKSGFHATSLIEPIVISKLVIALLMIIKATPSRGPITGSSNGSATREKPIPEILCTTAANMKMETMSMDEHTLPPRKD